MSDKDINWELKDRRIAWMNINSACAEILSARISMGCVSHKTNKEAVDDLLSMIEVEYNAFLCVSSDDKPKVADSSGKFFCTECNKEVTEKIKNYSEKHFGMVLCYDCQKQK